MSCLYFSTTHKLSLECSSVSLRDEKAIGPLTGAKYPFSASLVSAYLD